ncbi:MAG: hypothetical protein HQ582_32780 [Planctomycetes bacterium]|nr:hypothetical protein [Planctomycetota bacterium]
MAKAQKLGGWMTRFKRCIDAEAGAAVSKKVIIKTEQFDGTWKTETERREYDCGRVRLVLLRTGETDEGAVSHGYILSLLNGMV